MAACLWKPIDLLAFVDVHYVQLSLVRTSSADAVDHQLAIVRCVEQADVRSVIGAEGVRIDEDQSLLKQRPRWKLVEQRVSVFVLRIDPCSCFRVVLVFEPTIGINDLDAVHDFTNVVDS